jgi:proteasome lid subunit RPN8/RPN11
VGAVGAGVMLRISRGHRADVIAHCHDRYPKEACGILAGAKDAALPDVTQVYPMANVEDSPIGYSMDPKEQLQVEKQMRLQGQRMLGIYHSHTATEAYPSPVDVRLSISPDVSYVLVSLRNRQQPELKSYRITGETIVPEAVEVD